MRGNRALAKASRFREGAGVHEAPQPSSSDCEDGERSLSLSLLGICFRWADPTGGVTEVLERTNDEFSVRTRIIRDTIEAIQRAADEVREKQRGLTEMLRSPAPDPEVIDTLKLAIDERRGQIERLGREAVERLRSRRTANDLPRRPAGAGGRGCHGTDLLSAATTPPARPHRRVPLHTRAYASPSARRRCGAPLHARAGLRCHRRG
jgi:hypothetical protein